MKKTGLGFLAVVAGALFLTGAAPADPPQAAIYGFTPASAQTEMSWETKFRAIPEPANVKANLEHLAAYPHHVSSPYDEQNSRWILNKFKSWGWNAHIETFDVLFPTPQERLLEMTAPTKFKAKLAEPPVPGDPTSSQTSLQLPTYNIYSVDGDVTAPLVYVNYGMPRDYEELQRLGISVKGAIIIARYGGGWRGIKPKVGAEHGAIGCIIYSDPRDDGYFEGNTFPKGPMRPPEGVQRGSVMDMPLYAGDPQTPGWGSVAGAKRIPIKDLKVLARIPTLPISYADAEPLLKALTGPMAPEKWRGALPFPYHVGPGPTRVHLKLKFNWDVKPVHDVIATLAGSELPDQWVIRGNHFDAWVNGAQDPVAGISAELEEARALGKLAQEGWKPKRTIIYCAWDGEEEGLLGSTEWAETHAKELERKAVAYLNSDTNGRGFFFCGASHSLQTLVSQVAGEISDPETSLSVARRRELAALAHASDMKDADKVRKETELPDFALGSGSDYTVFIDHLGIPSLDMGFSGEEPGGIYHSIYDDIYWYEHFDDTKFVYGRALAQTAGSTVMRLADAEIIPLNFDDLSNAVAKYVDQCEELLKSEREKTELRRMKLSQDAYRAASDPQHPTFAPPQEEMPPYLNFAPLENARVALKNAAQSYQAALTKAFDSGALDSGKVGAVNAKLMACERAVLAPQGLPGRPWFENEIYAPGFYTGYGVKTLPAVREAVEQHDWKLADEQINVVAGTLQNLAGAISSATGEFK